MLTKWGYEINIGSSCLPPIATLADFNEMTASKYADDRRVPSLLMAASDAVRSYCGWHVAPSLDCTCTLTAEGRVAELPLRDVTEVMSVEEDGQPVAYDWKRSGMVRNLMGCFKGSWDGLTVRCKAGTSADNALKSAVCSMVAHRLAAPAGVSQESAGAASITYKAEQLSDMDRIALEPYRLVM